MIRRRLRDFIMRRRFSDFRKLIPAFVLVFGALLWSPPSRAEMQAPRRIFVDLRSLQPDAPRPIRDFFPDDIAAVCGIGAYGVAELVRVDGTRLRLPLGPLGRLTAPADLDLPLRSRGRLEPNASRAVARFLRDRYDPFDEGTDFVAVLTRSGAIVALEPGALLMPPVRGRIYIGQDPPCVRADGRVRLVPGRDRHDLVFEEAGVAPSG
jgi:hypothetical protein